MTLKLALDQNFPVTLLRAIDTWLPGDIEIRSIRDIDPRLSNFSDRDLVLCLSELGWDGLISNNYKIVNNPDEIAAFVGTKMIGIFTKQMGQDPIRAAGTLLLELPGLADRLQPGRSNIFMLKFDHRAPRPAWEYLAEIGTRHGVETSKLWSEYKPLQGEGNAAVARLS